MKRPLPGPRSYPKQIKILDEIWNLRWVHKYEDPDQVGETDSELREITIKLGQSKKDTLKTYVHELIHVLEYVGKMDLKHKNVYTLEELVYSLITENFYGRD